MSDDLEKDVLEKFNEQEKTILKEKEKEILEKIIETIENEKTQ